MDLVHIGNLGSPLLLEPHDLGIEANGALEIGNRNTVLSYGTRHRIFLSSVSVIERISATRSSISRLFGCQATPLGTSATRVRSPSVPKPGRPRYEMKLTNRVSARVCSNCPSSHRLPQGPDSGAGSTDAVRWRISLLLEFNSLFLRTGNSPPTLRPGSGISTNLAPGGPDSRGMPCILLADQEMTAETISLSLPPTGTESARAETFPRYPDSDRSNPAIACALAIARL
jgi:hypothetical protein